MGIVSEAGNRAPMATRWRRRRMCVLVAESPAPAALLAIDATGARLGCSIRPDIGTSIELRHPEAGAIHGCVSALTQDGVAIAFPLEEASVAFALAAIAADMSRPA